MSPDMGRLTTRKMKISAAVTVVPAGVADNHQLKEIIL